MKITKRQLKQIIKEELSKVLNQEANYEPRAPTKGADGAWQIPWVAPGDDEEFITTLKFVGAEEADPGGGPGLPASPMTRVHMEINGQKEEFMAETPRELFDRVVTHITDLESSDPNHYWFVNTEHGKPFIKQIEKVIAAMPTEDFLGADEISSRRTGIGGD